MHVSAILLQHGFSTELAIAGLLHDVVEDQDVALADLESQFGPRVAEIVAALSEHKLAGDGDGGTPGKPRSWRVRKEEAVEQIRQGSRAAAAVKAADTLHNVQSIAFDLRHEGDAVWQRFTRGPDEMLGYYAQIVRVVREKLGDHALVLEMAQAVEDLVQMVGPLEEHGMNVSRGSR
jgi:(p)ppGpp synthase/HD superfamily hydrolase